MSVTRFQLRSTLTPAEVMAVLTDFSPARAQRWPSIDAEHFQVHGQGENWAEVTEGTAAAWERARYEWSADRVTVTTRESKLFGTGGGWVFALTADDGGTKVDVELTREPHNVKQRLLAAALPLVGVGPLRKSFEAALKGQ
ncbi:hypothetical protein [Kutzneria chonburiensis]|uniref:SRPBCC family protein n=1 Tax=Kutzneria chonburiensis TaxID=1483604 RepID=A0ABV6MLK8_9PSEU|nr:hypothetical protein [Kutzneria chonburiensis]